MSPCLALRTLIFSKINNASLAIYNLVTKFSSLVCLLPFIGLKNRDLFKVYIGHLRLALLLAVSQGICTDFLESRFYKLEVKKHIFYQCFHLILIVIAYIPY